MLLNLRKVTELHIERQKRGIPSLKLPLDMKKLTNLANIRKIKNKLHLERVLFDCSDVVADRSGVILVQSGAVLVQFGVVLWI